MFLCLSKSFGETLVSVRCNSAELQVYFVKFFFLSDSIYSSLYSDLLHGREIPREIPRIVDGEKAIFCGVTSTAPVMYVD